MKYSLKQVCEKYQIRASTIRYYEQEQILRPIQRENGIRYFVEEDLHDLEIVQCLKRTKMPIHHIREFMSLYHEKDATKEQRNQILDNHRKSIQAEIEQLNEYAKTLERKMKLWNK